MRWPWPVALVAAALTAALLAAGWALAALAPGAEVLGIAAAGTLVAGLSAVLGVIVAHRARRNVVGALLVLIALGDALTATREIGWRGVARPPAAPPRAARPLPPPPPGPVVLFWGPPPLLPLFPPRA